MVAVDHPTQPADTSPSKEHPPEPLSANTVCGIILMHITSFEIQRPQHRTPHKRKYSKSGKTCNQHLFSVFHVIIFMKFGLVACMDPLLLSKMRSPKAFCVRSRSRQASSRALQLVSAPRFSLQRVH